MAITMKDFESVLEAKAKMDEKTTEEFFNLMPADHDRELVKQVCDTFTRLLLSITPYKAKEFVEKNCARVRRKIMGEVNEQTMRKFKLGENNE